MIAAQYEIALPTDYDMGIIRHRVAERGRVLDDRVGLGLKAYLIRNVAEGSPVNAYAPFYLWRDPDALAAFHWGGQGFSGIVRDFGRPIVRTWIGGGFERGTAFAETPTYAVRELRPLRADVEPTDAADRLRSEARLSGGDRGVHSRAWGIDPAAWQTIVFTLLTRPPRVDEYEDSAVFRVLHLSAPEIGELS